MPQKKYKKLTNREKEWNKKYRKELIEKGLMDPPKKRINRKKYVDETKTLWDKRPECYTWDFYILNAITYMMCHRDRNFKLSQEAVGAAKVLRLALKLREFNEKLSKEGKKEFRIADQMEFIKDIYEA